MEQGPVVMIFWHARYCAQHLALLVPAPAAGVVLVYLRGFRKIGPLCVVTERWCLRVICIPAA